MAVARGEKTRSDAAAPPSPRQGAAKTSPFAERAAMDAEMARRHVNEQSAPPRPWILVLRMTAGTWRSDSSALPKYGVGGANLTTAGCDGAAWLPASHAIGGELAHANQVFDGMPMREAKERWVATMTGTVKVHNVSLKASEQDISEFFSFSGEIIHVELQSCDERSQFAYITFRDIQGAERAMLLTGATIEHMAVIITPATDYKLPASVLADLESKNTGGMESALQKAEDIVGSMLAKGFVLGMDAVEKAKAFDEKHQLTSTATAKVASLDRTMGLSQKFSTGTLVVNEKMKEMDEKYQVAEKTKSALAAAEQTVSTASSAIMSNRYILTGAAWVTDAYNKVATTTTDVSTKTKERMMAEWEGANQSSETTKFDSLESSEADEQECKRHEDDSTNNFIVDSPEMTCQESEHQAGERQMTNVEGNSKMIIEEQKNHEGQIAVAHMQENTETAEKNPRCHQSEVSKANVHDSVLMTEQCEREHKQPEGEFGKTHVPGSPVTIPVTMSTIDGNSSNSPKKPHSAEGFL